MTSTWTCGVCGEQPIAGEDLAEHLATHGETLKFDSFHLHVSTYARKRPLPADTGEGPPQEETLF